MEIRECQYLLEIEKEGHLSKAASNLYVTQPALTRVLKKLEAEFNSPIFSRDNGLLVPTEMGRIILDAARDVNSRIQAMHEAIDNYNNNKQGVIRIGIPLATGFPLTQILSEFSAAFPRLDIIYHESGGAEAISLMEENKLDIIFVMRPIPISGVNEHLIVSSEVVVGFDETHPWAEKEYITDNDFNNMEYISADLTTQLGQQLNERFHKSNINAIPKVLGTRASWLIDFSRSTGIPFILPATSIRSFSWPTMVTRKFKPSFPWELCLCYSKNTSLNSAANLFVQFFITRLQTLRMESPMLEPDHVD